jgi:hypothetical protein
LKRIAASVVQVRVYFVFAVFLRDFAKAFQPGAVEFGYKLAAVVAGNIKLAGTDAVLFSFISLSVCKLLAAGVLIFYALCFVILKSINTIWTY